MLPVPRSPADAGRCAEFLAAPGEPPSGDTFCPHGAHPAAHTPASIPPLFAARRPPYVLSRWAVLCLPSFTAWLSHQEAGCSCLLFSVASSAPLTLPGT